MLVEKSLILILITGMIAFHFACRRGCKNLVKMMMKNTSLYKIDLVAKDMSGKTGFWWAKVCHHDKVVNFIKGTMPKIAF